MAETNQLKLVLKIAGEGRTVDAALAQQAAAELKRIENLLRIGRHTRNHARQLYLDGQLDKYPTSDSGPEYKLWRLVKKEGDE